MTHLYATAHAALNTAALNNYIVRIFYGDPVTGVDDCNETYRFGRVRPLSDGSFAMLITDYREPTMHNIATRYVVRVTRLKSHTDLYRHASYATGQWAWRYNDKLQRWTAMRNGLIHATFADDVGAAIYCAYITGDRKKPVSGCRQLTYANIVKRSTLTGDTYYYKGGPNADE